MLAFLRRRARTLYFPLIFIYCFPFPRFLPFDRFTIKEISMHRKIRDRWRQVRVCTLVWTHGHTHARTRSDGNVLLIPGEYSLDRRGLTIFGSLAILMVCPCTRRRTEQWSADGITYTLVAVVTGWRWCLWDVIFVCTSIVIAYCLF